MESLPLEITEKILSGLPKVSHIQCRQVCTTWRTLLPKPKMGLLYGVSHRKADGIEAQFYFSEQHNGTLAKLDHSLTMPFFQNHVVNHKSFMVGSYAGLVCYAGYASSTTCERKVYICNPFNGEHIQAPASNWDRNASQERAIGFGYDHSKNEYKVVRIMSSHNRKDSEYRDGRIRVYTLQVHGGTVWRDECSIIENRLLPQLCASSPSVGVFARGALHWIGQSSLKTQIIAFDLEREETFELLPSMPCVGHDVNNVGLMVLEGNLCGLEVVPGKHITVWESSEYTQEHRGHFSPWVTKFSIAWEDYRWFEPFALTKSVDKWLLWHNVVLSCYDPATDTFRMLNETLRKIICTPSVYTTARATPHLMTEERVGKKIKRRRNRKTC